MSEKIKTYNVSGELFTIHLDRLHQVVPESLLITLAVTENTIECDKEGNIYLDLDPSIFKIIWKYILLGGNNWDHVIINKYSSKTTFQDIVSKNGVHSLQYNPGVQYIQSFTENEIKIPLCKMVSFLNMRLPMDMTYVRSAEWKQN